MARQERNAQLQRSETFSICPFNRHGSIMTGQTEHTEDTIYFDQILKREHVLKNGKVERIGGFEGGIKACVK